MKPTPKRQAKKKEEAKEVREKNEERFAELMHNILTRIKQLELDSDRIKTRLGL